MTARLHPALRDRIATALRSTTDSLTTIAIKHGVNRKTVQRISHEVGAPRLAPASRPLPADFLEYGARETSQQLQDRYAASQNQVHVWRKLAGINGRAVCGATQAKLLPQTFARVAPTMTRNQLRLHYGVGECTVTRWLAQAGVKAMRPANARRQRHPARATASVSGDGSLAARAVDECLRARGPLFRCDADGKPNARGTHWRRGLAVLTDDEVIERAERLGWDRDGWRRVAA